MNDTKQQTVLLLWGMFICTAYILNAMDARFTSFGCMVLAVIVLLIGYRKERP